MIAFAYLLITVVVALAVPLAITLQRRGLAELEARALVQTQLIAANIGGEGVAQSQRPRLEQIVTRSAEQTGGRVIVVNEQGVLIADSTGTGTMGSDYATSGRPELRTALDEEQPTTVIRHSDELRTDLLAAAAPILDEGRLFGAVRVTSSMADVNANVRRSVAGLAVVGLAVIVAGLVVAAVVAASLAKPLSRLAQKARHLGDGDLATRAGDVGGPDEVQELAGSFDDMAERLQSSMNAQRDFVANASHQLRTPLTGMKLRLETAMDETHDAELLRQLHAADTEVDRLSGIVNRLLVQPDTGSVPGEGGADAAVTDLGEAVAAAGGRWQARADAAGVALIVDATRGVPARADAADVAQILDNLVDNALHHGDGPIEVRDVADGGVALLQVRDHGPGIETDERSRVTERFYRGAQAAPGGSGLGLPIIEELAARSGGDLNLSAPPGGGLLVTVRFPVPP